MRLFRYSHSVSLALHWLIASGNNVLVLVLKASSLGLGLGIGSPSLGFDVGLES